MGLFSRSEPATHFPEAVARRLGSGDEVRLPDDLPADATLLVVSFRDDLDPLADQWARLGDRLVDAHGDRVGVWELPVVNRKLKKLGKLATMGIRGQVHGDDERARTVPLYVDPKAFRKALRLKQGDVYAFLVDRAGRIAWRGEGDIDMEEVEALEQAVAEVLEAPVPHPTQHPDRETDAGGGAEPGGDAESPATPPDEPVADAEGGADEPDAAVDSAAPPTEATGAGLGAGDRAPTPPPLTPQDGAFEDGPPPVG